MFLLQGAQMLQMLEKSLRKSLPVSLKVYGTVVHMNHGNPFNLKALVDKWPDFRTVVVRPQEQDMNDDLDHYTNTYHVYSEDLKNCKEFLDLPEVINWKQHLQIQSTQSSLNEVIQNLAATKSFKVKRSKNILYMASETIKELTPSLLGVKNLPVGDGKPKAIDPEMFKLSSAEPSHAALVNRFWLFGGNERSLRFIERCIRNFPTFCLLGPEGTPVSWSLMDQTGEMRMAGTLPEYRAQGLVTHAIYQQAQCLLKQGFPVYSHVDPKNQIMQKISQGFNHVPMPCDWNQWNCEPLSWLGVPGDEHFTFWKRLLLLIGSSGLFSVETAFQTKVPAKMLHLQGPQMLQMLEKALRKSIPESLKVYGTTFHINQGNPFKLKALVDKWPDFNTVVIRPQEQEMTDDLDHYTNTYQVYSKDPKKCQEFLGSPEVINWKQHLQIQSSQSSLDDVIKNLAATKSGKVKQTQCFLYMTSEAGKKLATSLLEAKSVSVNGGKHKPSHPKMLTLSTLDPAHAVLVNKLWYFGGNERSRRFIERCIQTFPSSCLLGPEGTPVSWMLMDQTGELRMAGTLPEYRAQGLISYLSCVHVQTLDKLGFPLYSHVDKANHIMQRVCSNMQSILLPCSWNQWNYVPL
ncbi:hypothetical protein JEQ12_006672 [Ovis aries]|uniref:Glycine N-acyltransferase-like protein n=2 Tax=Ovis aries TaxID=9940 RepID=A0A836A069_SHEEP|nr:hypothetical protein JEQ12_006672 [Ovis aries]